MEASTALISAGPKPVTVLLCLGLVKPGPTGPWISDRGALVEGLRSLAIEGLRSGRGRSAEAMVVGLGSISPAMKDEVSNGGLEDHFLRLV